MKTVKEVKAHLKIKSARIQAFMGSELGKEVIKMLEDEFFNGPLFDSDPHVTAYNLGRRDAVMYLKELQNWSET